MLGINIIKKYTYEVGNLYTICEEIVEYINCCLFWAMNKINKGIFCYKIAKTSNINYELINHLALSKYW